jgi:hypothetical protein
MRRALLVLVALVIAAALPAMAVADDNGKSPEKVTVWHLAEVVPVYDEVTGELVETCYLYKGITFAMPALDAHLLHGDLQEGDALPDGTLAPAPVKGETLGPICVPAPPEPEPEPEPMP